MTYRNQINDMLSDVLREDWMKDEDLENMIDSLFGNIGVSYEALDRAIVRGIENGYSVKDQITMMGVILEEHKKQYQNEI